MGKIDSHILEIKEYTHSNTDSLDSLKQKTLAKFAMQYSKEQIYQELHILASKHIKSKDEILRILSHNIE